MSFYRYFEATISGDRLMMHNVRLADPLDPHAKALKALSGNKKKSDADHLEIARVEWTGGLYHDEKLGPYVPAEWLTAMLIEGAKKRRQGTLFSANVSIVDEKHPLKYDGPRSIEGLWKAGSRFVDRRGVGVQDKKVIRTRPIFRDWSVTFAIQLLECEINPEDLEMALEAAGPFGIGDGRPLFAGKFALQAFAEMKARKSA